MRRIRARRDQSQRFVRREVVGVRTDAWAGLLATGSYYSPRLPKHEMLSGDCGFCPRIQRRDRDGFTPSSLFFCKRRAYRHPCRGGILPREAAIATTKKESTWRGPTSYRTGLQTDRRDSGERLSLDPVE